MTTAAADATDTRGLRHGESRAFFENMKIEIIPAYDRKDDIAELFTEYTEMLKEKDPTVSEYLSIQNYDSELSHLEEKYCRLYLALCDGECAGCIAMRRLNETDCEMKRLYVRPRFRGKKIGETLVSTLITEAEEMGFHMMYLDTLPYLDSAIRLYERTGFHLTEKYNDSPMDTSIFMKHDLL